MGWCNLLGRARPDGDTVTRPRRAALDARGGCVNSSVRVSQSRPAPATTCEDEGMDPYLSMNRDLWDEWTAIHETLGVLRPRVVPRGRRAPGRRRDRGHRRRGRRSVLHLQCHFGIDTLSFARLGADVTGADFSPQAVALATRLAAEPRTAGALPGVQRVRPAGAARGRVRRGVHLARRPGLAPRHPGVGARRLALREARRHVLHHRGAPARVGHGRRPAHPPRLSVLGARGATDVPGRGFVRGSHRVGRHAARALVEPRDERDHPGAGRRWTRHRVFREYPWCDWDLGYTVQHEDGRWYLPDDQEGELPLFYALRARKPSSPAATR